MTTAQAVTPEAQEIRFVKNDPFRRIDATELKAAISGHEEIALIDTREEGVFGKAHLLLAVNVPLSRLELRIERLVPRHTTRIVVIDDGDGLSEQTEITLAGLGYSSIEILSGGNKGWQTAGFELFSGMSVPTKAFGEWIAVTCNTPVITPEELHKKLSAGEDVLVLDSRPANEYWNMTIPGAINVPVSELVYRFGELPVTPETLVVVNCAGRTRSLIGAQTLIDAMIPNRVAALKGGTMAWQLAGFDLEHGATRSAPEPSGEKLREALDRARAVAERNRVQVIDEARLKSFQAEQHRSLYIIDVRTPDEFRAGHRPDSFHAWGVQLVQSIDKYVATRNARLILVDNHQVRALLSASWLVQAGWSETYVLSDPFSGVEIESGDPASGSTAAVPNGFKLITPAEMSGLLDQKQITLFDFSDSLSFKNGHIPGAWFAIRSRLVESLAKITAGGLLAATGSEPALTALAAADLSRLSARPVSLLDGGNQAWLAGGFKLETGFDNLAAETEDVFRMPFLWGHFEDRIEFETAAQDYFDWELQLPEQIHRANEIEFVRRGDN